MKCTPSLLLHLLHIIRNIELRTSLLLDFLHLDARRELRERQLALLAVHLEHTLLHTSAQVHVWV